MNLEQTIVLWLNKYLDQQIKSFESLSDGKRKNIIQDAYLVNY